MNTLRFIQRFPLTFMEARGNLSMRIRSRAMVENISQGNGSDSRGRFNPYLRSRAVSNAMALLDSQAGGLLLRWESRA